MNRTRLLVPAALLYVLVGALTPAHAQFSDFGKKLRQKVEQKVEQRVDRKTDKAVDDTLDKVECVATDTQCFEKAKAEGKFKGRSPTARRQASAVLQLRREGVGPAEIGRRLGIGRSSVYRILALPVPAERRPAHSQPSIVQLDAADLPAALARMAQGMQTTYEATSGKRKRRPA